MLGIADPHLAPVRDEVPQTPEGCAECLRPGPPRAHHIVGSFEPGESRDWCHADEPYV
jgi:hypothetical protein